MKIKVAVICAANPGNSGMYSVDLAAFDLLTRNGIEFDLFTSHTPSRLARYKLLSIGIDIGFKKNYKFGRLLFNNYNDVKQLKKYSHVIFWGDFTPNPVYGYEDFAYFDKIYNVRSSQYSPIERWSRLFNFSEGKIRQKVMAIGNNFQHDYSGYTSDCKNYLERMLHSYDLFMPRDSHSVENIRYYLNLSGCDIEKVKAGLDPAFLLKNWSVDRVSTNKNTFCYAFGRSNLPDVDEIISRIELETDTKSVHLSEWLKLEPASADYKFTEMINNICNARFVVTDLYHVAINCMRHNVPVFCIGKKISDQRGTLGDFKKKILFSMLGLERYYYEVDPESESHLDFIVKSIKSDINLFEKNVSKIYEIKTLLADSFERSLVHELKRDL